MKIKCIQCGTEFESKRKTAKFCSDLCRVTANRNKDSVTNDTLKEDSVTEPPKIAASASHTFTAGLDEYQSMMKLYDTFTASQLVAAGLRPPKWKKQFKTHQEAVMACRKLLKQELGIEYIIKDEDYSKWM